MNVPWLPTTTGPVALAVNAEMAATARVVS